MPALWCMCVCVCMCACILTGAFNFGPKRSHEKSKREVTSWTISCLSLLLRAFTQCVCVCTYMHMCVCALVHLLDTFFFLILALTHHEMRLLMSGKAQWQLGYGEWGLLICLVFTFSVQLWKLLLWVSLLHWLCLILASPSFSPTWHVLGSVAFRMNQLCCWGTESGTGKPEQPSCSWSLVAEIPSLRVSWIAPHDFSCWVSGSHMHLS